MEEWKNIKGTNGAYQISNLGNVKSLKYNKERILKSRLSSDGYYKIHFYINKKEINKSIHRLVAEHFLELPQHLEMLKGTIHLQVNHKDEDKSNNRVENLEWCSAKYNSNYGTRIKRRMTKINKSIIQYTIDGVFVKKWKSIKDATFALRGYKSGRIVDCLKGRATQAYGYKWYYAS